MIKGFSLCHMVYCSSMSPTYDNQNAHHGTAGLTALGFELSEQRENQDMTKPHGLLVLRNEWNFRPNPPAVSNIILSKKLDKGAFLGTRAIVEEPPEEEGIQTKRHWVL